MMLMLLMLFVSMRCHILLSSSRFFFYFCINLFYFIFFRVHSGLYVYSLSSLISHLTSRWRSDDGVEFFSRRVWVCVFNGSSPFGTITFSFFDKTEKKKNCVWSRCCVCAVRASIRPLSSQRTFHIHTLTPKKKQQNKHNDSEKITVIQKKKLMLLLLLLLRVVKFFCFI